MAKYTYLSKAPIIEALIDIRVKLNENFDIDKLNSIYDIISNQYLNRQELRTSQSKIEFKNGESPKVTVDSEKNYGYRFSSNDGKQVLQVRSDGFTFSRLKPYEDWAHLRDEAYRLWQQYVQITSPELITRVALRYINKIDIPLPINDFSEYLIAAPIVPSGLPQGVSSFLTRFVIPEPSINVIGIITQALEQIVDPKFAPVILDIDVFKQSSTGIDAKEAWELIEKLRNFKNKIFFESITEKLKGLFYESCS